MRGFSSIASATLRGTEALPITVEVAVSDGLPGMRILGMSDAAELETRERVRLALRASGFSVPHDSITVNLTPGDVRKLGTAYDLPIAVGILAATGQIPLNAAADRLFAGELSLDGRVLPVRGSLAYALCARNMGLSLVVSSACENTVAMNGVEMLGVSNLTDFRTGDALPLGQKVSIERPALLDFSDIAGHEGAKRALQVASPDTCKTMLALRIPSILPPLDDEERLLAALIRSVASAPMEGVLGGARPLRTPHCSVSMACLLGGGRSVFPGEVTLAHGGVLLLDDIQEFAPAVLQGIRQAAERGRVQIARAEGTTTMPANFTLVATGNPCPCGHYGERERECTCAAKHVKAYQNRLAGPLADRIDIQIDLSMPESTAFLSARKGTSSEALREGVMRAHEFATWRAERESAVSDSMETLILRSTSDEAHRFMENAATAAHMDGRSIVSAMKVARTIADMDESPEIGVNHVAEALALRPHLANGDA